MSSSLRKLFISFQKKEAAEGEAPAEAAPAEAEPEAPAEWAFLWYYFYCCFPEIKYILIRFYTTYGFLMQRNL